MKSRNGFTLIELLAVIIILGILMLVAIPSVTKYIDNSRKETYIDTAKQYIKGATNLVNSGELDIYDIGTTYYIPSSCIGLETGGDSPYGEFDPAYIVVTYDNNSFDYYWISRDSQGMGISKITRSNDLNSKLIAPGVKEEDVASNKGIDGRNNIIVFSEDCSSSLAPKNAEISINGITGEENDPVCRRATTLHTAKCTASPSTPSGACYYDGYHAAGSKGTDTITFGNLGTDNVLNSGDAFDCDVNNDGNYNPTNERFYYLTTHGNNAVLIYYTNISNNGTNVISVTGGGIAYNNEGANGQNWSGPIVASGVLPTTSQWSNPGIVSPGKRQIVTNGGGTSTGGGTIVVFDYGNKAARLPTYQEIVTAAGPGDVSHSGYLGNSEYLLEKLNNYTKGTHSSNDFYDGYWLETPAYDYNWIWNTIGHNRQFNHLSPAAGNNGVRPVIEVSLTNIDY
jgi:prepilin-type N-terminal cleavage/methylation domain-containing protein